MPQPTPIYQVDAFTDRAFAGNPAGVAVLDADADAGWMQSVAAEMNVAETAFLVRAGDGRYGLRWFSPTVEIPLCGHATLASAHVLWSEGVEGSEVLSFDTMSGELRARRVDDGLIELDFPASVASDAPLLAGVEEALGVVPVRTAATESGWVLVEVASAAEVRACRPDLVRVAALSDHAVILTARGDADGPDIVSRVFAPAAGIPEDPVTGSAHCVLATWWWDRVGTPVIDAEQASARGGRLLVVLDGDRVRLRGTAVTTLAGVLRV
jgi:PhzF family phenazine biosynthesis protein